MGNLKIDINGMWGLKIIISENNKPYHSEIITIRNKKMLQRGKNDVTGYKSDDKRNCSIYNSGVILESHY